MPHFKNIPRAFSDILAASSASMKMHPGSEADILQHNPQSNWGGGQEVNAPALHCSGRRFSGHLLGESGPGRISALLLPVMTLLTHSYLGFSSFLALYSLSHSCFLGSPPLVGGIMVPMYLHGPIPDTCEYVTRTCEYGRGILQMWF